MKSRRRAGIAFLLLSLTTCAGLDLAYAQSESKRIPVDPFVKPLEGTFFKFANGSVSSPFGTEALNSLADRRTEFSEFFAGASLDQLARIFVISADGYDGQ